ncbi:cullin-1-like [Haemaphysalis longicornis]
MYILASRVPTALALLRTLFQEHVQREGLQAIERLGEDVKDPALYVTTLLRVHQKYNELVRSAFARDEDFVNAMGSACEKFVNNNAATRPPNSSMRSSELLEQYCNSLLLKGSPSARVPDPEDALKQATIVFSFLDDKDAFEMFYSQMMSERLLHRMSDYESQKVRININVDFRGGKQEGQCAKDKTVMEDRKLYIQAAIMRIMKARKKLTLEEIVAEVLKLLSSRFKPDVSMVKNCVGALKAKDYLETEEEDGQPVAYIYPE